MREPINFNSSAYDPRNNKNFSLEKSVNVKLNIHNADVHIYKSSNNFHIFVVEWKSWYEIWGITFINWHGTIIPETEKELAILLDSYKLATDTQKLREPSLTENENLLLETFRSIVEKEKATAVEDAISIYEESQDS